MTANALVSLRRGHHVDLPSHQRRLRHLRSVSGRNIAIAHPEHSLVDSYYTLHNIDSAEEIYRSELIYRSSNPNWAGIDPINAIRDRKCIASPAFIVRVWARPEGKSDFKAIINWTVDLGALIYIGVKVVDSKERHPLNSVVFGMFEGFYVAPPVEQSKLSREALEASLVLKTIAVERSLVLPTYTTIGLKELQRLQVALNDVRRSGKMLELDMERKWNQRRRRSAKRKEIDIVETRIRMLKDQTDRLAISLRSEKKELERVNAIVKATGEQLCIKRSEIGDVEKSLEKERKAFTSKLESFRDVRRRLRYRQYNLLCQLGRIFPISAASDKFSILNLPLPPAEKYSGFDDMKVGTALGFVVQLISAVSCILHIRLRYDVIMNGSMSVIRDHIRRDFESGERDFNLYARTKNREKFKYGIYLLNFDIFQLCQACELKQINDMAYTLPNLFCLFRHFARARDACAKVSNLPPAYAEIDGSVRASSIDSSSLPPPPPYEEVSTSPHPKPDPAPPHPVPQAPENGENSSSNCEPSTDQTISTMTKSSPTLIRGNTRLASAGFGAAAVAKSLRPAGRGKEKREEQANNKERNSAET